jgi:hypothetical protein
MTTLINGSNYPAIETAIGTIVQTALGVPFELGDYSKITNGTPMAVVEHGRLKSPVASRMPNMEDYFWDIPLHLFFDYTDDAEAHRLFSLYRPALINLFMQHRQLDDGNTSTYPPGLNGQAQDSKIISSPLPTYFDLDGKTYVLLTFVLWVWERLRYIYP